MYGLLIFVIVLSVLGLTKLAHAQSEALTNEPTSLTVQNNFSLVQGDPVNFGTYVVIADTAGANTATLTMNEGTGVVTPVNNAPAMFILVDSSARTRGLYVITSAAPSVTLNVNIANLNNLTCGGCTGSPPVITLTSVTADDPTPTTDTGGAANFRLGAVLTTVAGGNQYTDGTYSGDFDLTVSY